MKLPSPEEYGKVLAERRRKADRVPLILKKLDTMALGIAESNDSVSKLPMADVMDALDDIRSDIRALGELKELRGLTKETDIALRAIEKLQESVISGLQAMSEVISEIPKPAKAPRSPDYRPEFAELGRKLDGIQVPEPLRYEIPTQFTFTDIERDENGDISAANLSVQAKH